MGLATRRAVRGIQKGLRAAEIVIRRASERLPEVELSALVGGQSEHFVPEILDDICMPPHVVRWQYDNDDYDALAKVVKKWAPKSIVELGTAHGNTVANLCILCPDALICTVNAPVSLQSGVNVTFRLTEDDIGRVYRAHGFEHRVKQIFCNTLDLDLGRWVKPKSVDLAIVDACHDTEYVLNDFLKVKPFVRDGGIILLHDTGRKVWQHLAGSYLGCLRLRRRGYDIRHIRETWWGYWVA
jgi:hypothetical protein